MNEIGLFFERSVSDTAGNQSFGESPLNTIFVILFALLISYLALRIARRGGRRK